MFEFIKKMFGAAPAAPVVDAKVEAANSAPYKVPEPAVTPAAPVVKTKPAKITAPKKEGGKKPAPKKEGGKKPASGRGRKPKAK
jgi:hypothetical protein